MLKNKVLIALYIGIQKNENLLNKKKCKNNKARTHF